LPQVLDQWLRLGNAAAAFFLLPHVAVALASAGDDRAAAVVAGAVRAHIDQMPGFAGRPDKPWPRGPRSPSRRAAGAV